MECELSAANGCQAVAAVHAARWSAKQNSRAVELNEIIEAAQRELVERARTE